MGESERLPSGSMPSSDGAARLSEEQDRASAAGEPKVRLEPVIVSTEQRLWQAPYPPPDVAERYERLAPGTFRRLVDMAEREQQANVELSRQAQVFLRRDTRRMHWLGFTVSTVALAGAFVCVLQHEPLVAAVFLSVPVMGLARAFVVGAGRGGAEAAPDEERTGVDGAGDGRGE